MEAIRRLRVWRKAREISRFVWRIVSNEEYRRDPGLRWQILNSSGSIMDNIAEEFATGSNNEFRVFLGYARGST